MKKLSKVLAMVCAVLMFSTTVAAEEAMEVYVGSYQAADNQIQIQVSNNLTDENAQPQYNVSLGGSTLDILSVAEGEERISYLYLVDISGSIKSETRKQIEDVFNNLVAYMGFEDNAALMFVGNDAYFNDFTNDREFLVTEFTNFSVASEDTNLYYAINQALTILDTSEKCNERKCLVVLSDGEDDKIDGITAEEVKAKIEEVEIPVFCIETLGGNPSEKKVEHAKITGSFARMSPGGINFLYGQNDVDGNGAAAQIAATMKNYSIITADLSGFEPGASSLLEVSMTVTDKGTAKDGYEVNIADIEKAIIKKAEPEAEKPTEQEVVTQPVAEVEEVPEEADSDWIIWVVLAAVAVVIIAVVLSNNKKKKAVEENSEQKQPVESEVREKIIIKEVQVMVPEQKEEKHFEADITLTKMGNLEDEQVSLHIKDRITIGRVEGRADVVWATDELLSGVHCAIECTENGLYVADLESTNGTTLNGIPVTDARRLQNGDTIAMGSYEWRVEIK